MGKSWCSTDRICRVVHSAGVILALAAMVSPASGENWRAWPGEFLRMGTGARAMAMGNAYNAVDGDVFSSSYNPAGLASLEGRQFALSYRYMSMDRYFTHAVFGSRIGPDAGFAFSWLGAGTEGIQGRDLNGNRTGNLKDCRNSFGVTFAKSVGSRVSLGVTPKLSLWNLADDDAKAFGFDIGVLVHPVESLGAAFVVHDVNSRFTWESKRWGNTISGADGQPMEKEDKFPVYFTTGVAWKPPGNRLLLSAMVESVEDCPLGYDFGASYAHSRIFTLRAGVYNYTTTDGLDYGSFTAGFGLRVTGTIEFEYAFASDAVENDRLHVLSLVFTYRE